MSAEQLRKFLKSVEGDRLYAMRLMYATTGMRRGEVLGLRLRDVDHKHGRIAVVQSLLIVEHKMMFSEPSTNKGRRSVALDPTTAAALRSHRAGRHRSSYLPVRRGRTADWCSQRSSAAQSTRSASRGTSAR